MGILNSGIHGGFQNRTAGLIGKRFRGKNVISAMPHKSLIPRSVGQLVQQQKVTLLTSLLKSFNLIINIGFGYVKKQSPINAAFAHNYQIVFGDYPDYEINYGKLVCSRGKLQSLNSPLVSLGDELNTIKFSWLANEQNRLNRSTDYVCFVVYNTVKKTSIMAIKMVKRADLSYNMRLPSEYAGAVLHCYIVVTSAFDTSNSVYLKFINI